ncbi:MAG: D-alanine--D-alanine ligase, partial [Hymenobacteraceae bacterium]|nr:D-alanine--D-alanine ligase [Hymenobacteraceae bacterium]
MLRVGIFFGGPSREREISFAGGRTVFDNLDKALFEAVPVFVDSLGNFIQLDWQYLYKGTIRDFYPAPALVPQFAPATPAGEPWQVYMESLGALTHQQQDTLARAVGEPIQPRDFRARFDFAFLTLHGPYGEDGAIQGVLDWAGIPYSGAGLLPSAIGIDKIAQKRLLRQMGFQTPDFRTLSLDEWNAPDPAARPALFAQLEAALGLPFVVKAPHQGSSIGVSVVSDAAGFVAAVNRSLFQQELGAAEWQGYSADQKKHFARALTDIRSGIGLPLQLGEAGPVVHHPALLAAALDAALATTDTVRLLALTDAETQVLAERFVRGREFSCIVVETPDGEPLALPPTEIVKGAEVFDYRAKYLPGMARKVTPMDVPAAEIQRIRQQCQELFRAFQFSVYARLDGFYTAEGEIFLNDPNTTSGMLPASFFFHQAAEIGLNPSQLITTIIRTSLAARGREGKRAHHLRGLLGRLDAALVAKQAAADTRIPVAVVLGGYSPERHISDESGRNIYEKLASSAKYRPVPVFLSGNREAWRLHVLPINLLLKDNADDIRDQILKAEAARGHHPVLDEIAAEAAPITARFAGTMQRGPR